jgi:hypothetical protein
MLQKTVAEWGVGAFAANPAEQVAEAEEETARYVRLRWGSATADLVPILPGRSAPMVLPPPFMHQWCTCYTRLAAGWQSLTKTGSTCARWTCWSA